MRKEKMIWVACILFLSLNACADLTSIFDASARTAPAAKTTTTPTKTEPAESEQTKVREVKLPTAQVDHTDISRVVDAKTGQRKPIVTKKGTYYFVAAGDSLVGIAKAYKISEEDLAQINDLFDSQLVVGRRLFIPKKSELDNYLTITNWIRTRKLDQIQSNTTVTFVWPVKEFKLMSGFGWRRGRPHNGIDLSAPRGTSFYAAADGQVIYSKKFAGYGNILVIQHARNYCTAYAHAQTLSVKEGDKVKQAQQIGTVGNTGRSTGPHLHFEVHKDVKAIDPVMVLPGRN